MRSGENRSLPLIHAVAHGDSDSFELRHCLGETQSPADLGLRGAIIPRVLFGQLRDLLRVGVRHGSYDGVEADWLRWIDAKDGEALPKKLR